MAARSSLAENTKLISAFMASEHRISIVGELDPIQTNGYNYLITGDRVEMFKVARPQYQMQLNVARDEVVTLQKIWQCLGMLLTGETGQQLKDICFSFALFKLLFFRQFGILIVGILFMAIAQSFSLIVSDWAMVLLICNYVRGTYDAPSGDPRAHVEDLAEGGEFVTHLWALLSHANILNNGSTFLNV
ncbi:hypothetical protein SLA2020_382810 [Shorea laevis]